MKIGDEVYIHGYIDEIRHIQGRPDMVIIRNNGGYFGTVRSEIFVIEKKEKGDKNDKT